MRKVIEVRAVSKRYGSVRALEDVSTEFFEGEIHCVLGENGAGKSTLMNVLGGFVRPDSGAVTLESVELPLGRPNEVRNLGVAIVHQHFMLVPRMTVEENLTLATLSGLGGVATPRVHYDQSVSAVKEVTDLAPPMAIVEDLPVGQRQRIELVKALCRDSKVVILDEPTAVLTPDEIGPLFDLLRTLRSEGRVILLIAHKLSEVMAIADRVTVLRRGRVVGKATRGEISPKLLTGWMVGDMEPIESRKPKQLGEVLLEVDAIHVRSDDGAPAVRGVSLNVRAGEILGIGGVDGNGQVELSEALAGVRPLQSGKITTTGKLGYIPQDRQKFGLALTASIRDNLWFGAIEDPRFYRFGLIRAHRVNEWCQDLVEGYKIRIRDLSDPASSLSGGNQQKIVVARTLSQSPQVLIVVAPTRGLDIKATNFVRQKLLAAAAEGAAVVLVSTDFDELNEVADRVIYLSRGVLAAELLGEAG